MCSGECRDDLPPLARLPPVTDKASVDERLFDVQHSGLLDASRLRSGSACASSKRACHIVGAPIAAQTGIR